MERGRKRKGEERRKIGRSKEQERERKKNIRNTNEERRN